MSATINGLDASACVLHNEHQQPSSKNDNGDSTLHGDLGEDSPQQHFSKPSFHVTAPSGWLNDPCGPGYDPVTGLYHLFFQWNPKGNNWGNMSWGHATSSDLASWKTDPRPALVPSTEYDRCGVFTGCLRATDIHGNSGGLTIIYTSVNCLPIHWTLPYVNGRESLSLAVSSDGGKTWERQACNPILPGPPQDLSVTGWRDPSIANWRGQQILSRSKRSDLCGLISGGIVAQTPTVFVYTVNPTDLREWQYEGPLVDVGLNFRPSRWSGDFGINWEVANLMTLTNEFGDSRDFVIMKIEGGLHPEDSIQNTHEARQRRHTRGQLWMSIKPSTQRHTSKDALTTYAFGGIFDHGCFYAANSFWDPQTSQHIVYGWITEEDLSNDSRHRRGWSGMVSLPRTVRLITLHNVKKARTSSLQSITSIEMVANASKEGNTFSIHTLGISPDRRLSHLRPRDRKDQRHSLPLPLSLTGTSDYHFPLTSTRWELQAEFAVGQFCKRVGIEIAHSPDFTHRTTLAWTPLNESFTIHRPASQDPEINHGYECAPHTLFTFINEQGEDIEETLKVHAFFDKSVLEVFVNERTVISTRIYHPGDRCFGMRFFAEPLDKVDCPKEQPALLLRANAWDGLGES
ncbi:unnamed protein product [Penicillium pancosmium]